MFRYFLRPRSRPARTKGTVRHVRLGVELLERRDCPSTGGSDSGPQLTLDALVQPNHVVELSGTLTDDAPAGAVVTFSGAVAGSATVDDSGNFSFSTDAASLGDVSAVAVDDAGQSSNTASATVAVDAPVLYLTMLADTDTSVTLAGTVQGIDPAGATVTISGVASDSATTDGEGNFLITTPLSSAGAIQASTTDLWGQASNTGEVDIASMPAAPQITLSAQVLAGHEVELTGTATDSNPAGVTVTFSGAVSGSAVTDADGNFNYVTQAASLGEVDAIGVDSSGESTNTVSATVAVDAPAVTLSVDDVTATTVTVSGTVSGIDPAGQTVSIGGNASDAATTDANGNFTITTAMVNMENSAPDTTSIDLLGSIQATTTDLWGQSSNVATQPVTYYASGPGITLNATVLPGHEVTLTGQVTDSQPAGIVVTFSGAVSGSATTDADGNYSFTTTDASTGTVYAVATDANQLTSNPASADVAAAPPTVSVGITAVSSATVTFSGTVADIDAAGETVTISGAKTGTATCDSDGNFSFTVDASQTGDVEVSTTDDWGQASNAADVTMPPQVPTIQNFVAVNTGDNVWRLQGQVIGTNVSGITVSLGGLDELAGVTTTVAADGSFNYFVQLPSDLVGDATAQAADASGLESDVVSTPITS